MSSARQHHVYLIGIGGIGMSALARYYKAAGSVVAGYDRAESDLTRQLIAEGIAVHYQDDPEAIPPELDLAIYTPAVPATLEELQVLKRRQVKLVKRAEALGLIGKRHKTLAVAGTHGKTTTSALAAYLMHEAKTDAVAFLGGITANYNTNYLPGQGEWLVVEADEYDRSFLHLYPQVSVVTYIEPDHLDIYTELGAFEQSFRSYVSQVGVEGGGVVITKAAIADTLAASLQHVEVQTYGLEDEQLDWSGRNIRVEEGQFRFDLHCPQGVFADLQLAVPGRHNVENAVGALAAVAAAGVSVELSTSLLRGFRGVRRRFEYLGDWRGAKIISDYAHHPTEVAAAINAAHQLFCSYRVIGIFQPHLFSRTRDFAAEFAAALSDLQEVVMLELYPARELPIAGISSMTIFSNITAEKKYLVASSEAPALLEVLNGDVLLFMGAGDIDDLARRLASASSE